jgi:DNA-binding transcriptional regulator YiaG
MTTTKPTWKDSHPPLKPEQIELCRAAKALRLQMGISQAEFARQCACGRRTVIEWEKERHSPAGLNLERLRRLKQYVDAGIDTKPLAVRRTEGAARV